MPDLAIFRPPCEDTKVVVEVSIASAAVGICWRMQWVGLPWDLELDFDPLIHSIPTIKAVGIHA